MAALTSDRLAALEVRLRPGGASHSGFLAPGQSLQSVLDKDCRALETLGLTVAQVADRLELVLGRAERMNALALRAGRPVAPDDDGARAVMVEPTLRVRSWHFRGHQDCPFDGHDGRPCPTQPWSSADFEVTNTAVNRTARVPGLLPHLVRAHSFFEGDVPYRVDPALLANLLAIEPGSHAKPEWRTERVWSPFSATGSVPIFGIGGPQKHWQTELMKVSGYGNSEPPDHWDQRFDVDKTITICRSGDWCVLVSRRPATLASDLRIDGSELAASRTVGKGTLQFRRVEFRYVPIEGE